MSAALTRRRMIRSFSGAPVDEELLGELAELSLLAPTAGNARGIELLLLVGPTEVAAYFAATTDARWRARSTRFAGLSRAAAVVLVLANPAAYVERYAAEDKRSSGLGTGPEAWPVPYWIGDAGAAAMALMLACEEAGLGCCFLGAFRGTDAFIEHLGAPPAFLAYGAILIGNPDGNDHRSASLDRPGTRRAQRVHRGRISRPAQP